MSACAIKHWGTGTPCVKESNTAASKELAAKLAQMRAERDKQDTMWHGDTNISSTDRWQQQEPPTGANLSQESLLKREKRQ